MNEIIKVNHDTMTVSGRDLHDSLEVKERFSLWAERLHKYFGEEVTIVGEPTEVANNGGVQVRELMNFTVSVDIAKHICLLSKTEKGRECRQYLIELEKAWNTPEQIMARALKIADQTIANLTVRNKELEKENAMMLPKADYFDALVNRNLLTNFRDTAKELKVGEKAFINFLIERKYIYRDQRKKLKPYANKNDGLFELKEFNARYNDHSDVQTLITPKGRETFRLLIGASK